MVNARASEAGVAFGGAVHMHIELSGKDVKNEGRWTQLWLILLQQHASYPRMVALARAMWWLDRTNGCHEYGSHDCLLYSKSSPAAEPCDGW